MRDQQILGAIESITETVDDILNKNVCNLLVKNKHKKLIQLFHTIKFNDATTSTLYEVILTHSLKSEMLAPGSFLDCIRLTLVSLHNMLVVTSDLIIQKKSDVSSGSQGRVIDGRYITKLIDGVSDKKLSSLIKVSLDLAGFSGKIMIEKSPVNKISVEKIHGYNFRCKTLSRQKLIHPRVVCIDGYVDGVGQANKLFEDAVSMKEKCVLFIRGASDDVFSTIKVNNDRGTMCIIPVIVDFDLQGINELNDISIVCGAQLTSSTRGDLISNVGMIDAPRVDSVSLLDDCVSITNSKTAFRVQSHISELRRKRDEKDIDDVIELIDKRIKSLMGSYVVIKLIDDNSFIRNSQHIDDVLRELRSATSHGIGPTGVSVSRKSVASFFASRCVSLIESIGTHVTTAP